MADDDKANGDAPGDLRAFVVQLAYRMLGSVQDAEDVAQDTWLRWQQAGPLQLERPRAWFAKTATNLCIDRLRSQQRSREHYHGEWLPEPWAGGDDADRHSIDETLSLALLHAIQRLNPAERAVFLLHDVFGYGFGDVAPMLDLDAANCRQLAVRARQHLGGPPRRRAMPEETERLGASFFAALRDGDVAALRRVLHDDVVLRSDGGGKVAAVHYPLLGRDRVARFFDRLFLRARTFPLGEIEVAWFNGAPGFLTRAGGVVTAAYQFDVQDGAIAAIHVQRNPDKLLRMRAR
ncbi:MAG TPA: RNA polymerase sigma factor SigJ [Planctomycetota bacterium]|nr:RNA polymerase sigma factor SigJ [Planctomycetota bacterium]